MGEAKSKRLTLKDIANRCNVSLTTVSRVLSNNGYPVNKAVKEKILRTAAELGYGSAGSARFFRAQSLKEIAAVIPSITNPFYTSLVAGFEGVVSREGYSVMVYPVSSGGSAPGALEEEIIHSILQKGFRGILVSSANMYTKFIQAAETGLLGDTKLVLADCPMPQNSHNSVCFDYKKGTFMGTSFLLENGHRNIVYAGLKLDRESRSLRVEGFKEALKAKGLDFHESMLEIYDEDTYDSDNGQLEIGERLAERILSKNKKITAIAAVNDMVAFGILRYLKRKKISVPDELSVLGYDDTLFCEASSPSLTTIKVQDEQIGRMAAKLLLDDISGNELSTSISLYLEPCLVKRESVAPLAHHQGSENP